MDDGQEKGNQNFYVLIVQMSISVSRPTFSPNTQVAYFTSPAALCASDDGEDGR